MLEGVEYAKNKYTNKQKNIRINSKSVEKSFFLPLFHTLRNIFSKLHPQTTSYIIYKMIGRKTEKEELLSSALVAF